MILRPHFFRVFSLALIITYNQTQLTTNIVVIVNTLSENFVKYRLIG